MINILAIGDEYAAADDHLELTDHRAALKKICRQSFRRIDRFTQLCLLGSARCTLNRPLAANTGLYIGSRFSSLSSTIAVHHDLFQQSQLPNPVSFINTLSNTAGFYVAKNLGITGKNVFVSRTDFSMEAAMTLAVDDLLAERTEQALVGIVDEVVKPLQQQRRRLGVDADSALGEGSHWFLLSKAKEQAQKPLARIEHLASFVDRHALHSQLQTLLDNSTPLAVFSASLNSHELSSLIPNNIRWQTLKTEPLHYYPALTAAKALRFIQHAHSPVQFLSINQDQSGRFYICYLISGKPNF